MCVIHAWNETMELSMRLKLRFMNANVLRIGRKGKERVFLFLNFE